MTLIRFYTLKVLTLVRHLLFMFTHPNKNITCEACKSRKDSLFSHFNCEEVSDLNKSKLCTFYKKRQPIFLTGSLPRGVYCLNKGRS